MSRFWLTALTTGMAGVMVVTILAFGSVAGFIALPALAALLIVIGVRTFKLDQVLMVWRTGTTQAVVMSVTFLLTLLVPMQYAVLAGVGISVILFVARQSSRVRVVRWVLAADGGPAVEIDPPATLAGGEVVVLTPYGSLFFASAAVFESQLPARTYPRLRSRSNPTAGVQLDSGGAEEKPPSADRDWNDLSERTKQTFKPRYDNIMDVLFGALK